MSALGDWVLPQINAMESKVKWLGATRALVMAYLDQHGEEYTPEELLTLKPVLTEQLVAGGMGWSHPT